MIRFILVLLTSVEEPSREDALVKGGTFPFDDDEKVRTVVDQHVVAVMMCRMAGSSSR